MTSGKPSCRAALLPAVLATVASLTSMAARAEISTEHRGEITAEASWYPESAAHAGQKDSFLHMEARPELIVYGDAAEVLIQPRISGGTAGDGSVDFREAHVTARVGDADILVGSTILFWGKVESYNPVDVVNAKDFSRGLMRSEKRGAPMLRLSWPVGPGQLDLLAVDFAENIYPGPASRERPAPRIAKDATYSGGAKRDDIASAIRWSGYFGDIDLGVSWFRGTGSAPRLLPQADGTLKPDYSRITQAGLDIQYLRGDSALKAELVRRSGQYDRLGTAGTYRAGVVGIEHNLYGVLDSGHDIVLIGEYARDSRKGLSHSGFQNDLTVGARWLWNDVEDTEMLGLVTRDLDNGAQTVTVSIDRRITDQLTFEASARGTARYASDPNSTALQKDSAVIMALTYGF
ncbi:MAG: hypothetical protein ACON31_02330 [Candidatus Puniceispirillaceae bacterium]